MSRPKIAASVIVFVTASSVAGFVAGSRLRSPAEVAARTAAPASSPILVPVEERVLTADVVTRGTGRYGSPLKLSVATSALKSNPGRVGELPLPGSLLTEGTSVVAGSGRPVFLLSGPHTMARDLGPGLSGSDVEQLEKALFRLGFDPGPLDGSYDERTETAVAAWYSASGFSPFTATVDQLASIRSREATLATARVDVISANDALATSDAALSAATAGLATATARVDAIRENVERARDDAASANDIAEIELASKQATLDALRDGTTVPKPSLAEVRAGEADIAAARANQTSVRHGGERTVAEAQAVLDRGPAHLAAATDAAAAASAAASADILAKQAAVAAASIAPIVADGQYIDVSRIQAQLTQAQADLAAARATAENARTAVAQAVSDAQAVLDRAPAVLEAAGAQAVDSDKAAASDVAAKEAALNKLLMPAPATPNEIASAERALAIATSNRDRTSLTGIRAELDAELAAREAAIEVDAKRAALHAAKAAPANARLSLQARSAVRDLAAQDADLARRRAGVQVPADELVFVPGREVRVSKLLVAPGDPVGGPMMLVSDSLVHVDGGLAVRDATLVRPGMAVHISEPDLGIATEGVVHTVATAPGTNGVDAFHVYFEVEVVAPPNNLVAASVRLTIPVASTDGATLTVPLSALTMAPDGTSRVQRRIGAATEFVAVQPGLSSRGFVAVTPTRGVLEAGDLVVVGVERTPRRGV